MTGHRPKLCERCQHNHAAAAWKEAVDPPPVSIPMADEQNIVPLLESTRTIWLCGDCFLTVSARR